MEPQVKKGHKTLIGSLVVALLLSYFFYTHPEWIHFNKNKSENNFSKLSAEAQLNSFRQGTPAQPVSIISSQEIDLAQLPIELQNLAKGGSALKTFSVVNITGKGFEIDFQVSQDVMTATRSFIKQLDRTLWGVITGKFTDKAGLVVLSGTNYNVDTILLPDGTVSTMVKVIAIKK